MFCSPQSPSAVMAACFWANRAVAWSLPRPSGSFPNTPEVNRSYAFWYAFAISVSAAKGASVLAMSFQFWPLPPSRAGMNSMNG